MGRHVVERSSSSLSKHLKRVHPLGIDKSFSSFTLSSLSLSHNSYGSSLDSSISSWDRKLSEPFRGFFNYREWREASTIHGYSEDRVDDVGEVDELVFDESKGMKRCNWITKSSDEVYVSFHDECWGVPVYDDSQLFELLVLSGMLIDQNWTEILKRKDRYREVFTKFDHSVVAKMEENEILEISSNKELVLAECRVRCIVENAKCIQKVAIEFGSFSGYIWGHMNYKPMVSKYRHPKSIPLRTPKAESISKDLLRRGFRLVGPVIVYSFMQAAGMAVDHLVDCYRFRDCARLAERSWGLAM